MQTLSSPFPAEPTSAPVLSPVFLPRFVRELANLPHSLRAEFERYVVAYDREAERDGSESLLDAVGGMKGVRFIENPFDVCVLLGLNPHGTLIYNSVIDRLNLDEEKGADLWTLNFVGEEDPMLIVVQNQAAETVRQMLRYAGGSSTPFGSVACFGHKEVK